MNGTTVRVHFKGDKVLEQVQKPLPLEHPAHQHFQLQRRLGGVALPINRAPHFEPLLIRGDRPHACLDAVGHHQNRIVMQQRGNLGLVGLQLRVGAPNRRLVILRALQFDEAQRHPIEEDHDIRPASALPFDHRELVHRQPVIGGGTVEIYQANDVPSPLTLTLRFAPPSPSGGGLG